MSITAYTTFADVRAVLGVSEKDLSDSTLSLAWYSDTLDEELEEVSTNLVATFLAATSAVTPSEDQKRLMRAVRIFAAAAVARTATAAIRLAAPQQVTDGKAAMTRFSDPIKELTKDVEAKYLAARDKVAAALSAIISTGSGGGQRPWFSVVSPSSDPVTG